MNREELLVEIGYWTKQHELRVKMLSYGYCSSFNRPVRSYQLKMMDKAKIEISKREIEEHIAKLKMQLSNYIN